MIASSYYCKINKKKKMNPISNGCQLCLDPFTEGFTTIDSPVLKHQMEKVFCFSIEPKQGYCCGVCQSCSNTISEFYQYSEKVRKNQEVLNGNVANCDRTINSNSLLEIAKDETLSNYAFPEKPEDACELENDVFSGEEVGVPISESIISHENVKHETLSDSGLPETEEGVLNSEDVVLGEQEDLILDTEITLENVKIEMSSDCGLLETTEYICELQDENPEEEEVLTLGSKITLEKVKVETLSDCELSDTVDLITKKAQDRAKEDLFFQQYLRMICDLCGTPAESFTALVTHFRREHKRSNGYVVCCNKKLFRRLYIREHIDYHINADVFRCQKCGISFASKHNLNRHNRNKHSGADRHRFKCDRCSQSFAKKPDFTNHIKWHVHQ